MFGSVCAGLTELGREIDAPGYLLKLVGPDAALRGALPERWRIRERAWFMIAGDSASERPLLDGYRLERDARAEVVGIRIRSAGGDLAAAGYAAETRNAFVYDRIVVAAEHRRIGLGSAVMAALARSRRDAGVPELLVATPQGAALYRSLGWRVLSPYATASIDPPVPPGALPRGSL